MSTIDLATTLNHQVRLAARPVGAPPATVERGVALAQGLGLAAALTMFLIAYGLFRFFHEFMRATPKPFFGISGYQWIALGTAVAAGIAYKQRAAPRPPGSFV